MKNNKHKFVNSNIFTIFIASHPAPPHPALLSRRHLTRVLLGGSQGVMRVLGWVRLTLQSFYI